MSLIFMQHHSSEKVVEFFHSRLQRPEPVVVAGPRWSVGTFGIGLRGPLGGPTLGVD